VFFRWLGSEDSLTHIKLKSPLGFLRLASVVVAGTLAAFGLVRRFRPDHILCLWVFPCGFWGKTLSRATGTEYSVWALGSDVWVLGKMPIMRRLLRSIGKAATHRYADGFELAGDFSAMGVGNVELLATSRVLEIPANVAVGSGGYFLYLGRFHPNKGIDLLIEALGRVRTRLPADFRLLAHGYGPLEASVRARVLELGLSGQVQIEGPTAASEVATILRSARGLIIPSRVESIPLVLSDGLQMELPLLVTDVGDMGRLVREHGAGRVCAPTVEGLADAVLEFASAPPAVNSTSLRDLLDLRGSVRRFLRDVGAT